ncbi:MAG: 2-oxoacid:ferredoxin oxidoreductase subunit beta [Pseudomonadales bacterium]|nr:2-oxoacid:ferredoxin oxidoreductase subunit beta [Pseudomonadales bacterium]
MTFVRPSFRHPDLPTNKVGYTKKDYEGTLSTLCAGCGHDSISAALVQACFELSIEPHRVAKISGIGCSSKTPTYFLGNSHGFNSVHGRMPSVATGANLANREMIYIGVSGDGDSASIGMGQFAHVVRRNLNMLYIVENNGCYGLTKGQDSATADVGSTSKSGVPNMYQPIDLVRMALELGATFVARSFSGDKAQLVPLIKAAVRHTGFAFIDVVSPCVTFNNTVKSTKSYDYVRDHIETSGVFDFVPMEEEIVTQYDPGTVEQVQLHDGSVVNLHKLNRQYDPRDRYAAFEALQKADRDDQLLTGLIYINPGSRELHETLKTPKKPLRSLGEKELCPGNEVLETINESLR